MLINRFSPTSSLSQRGIIIVSGKQTQPAPAHNSAQERGIIIVGGKTPQRLSQPPADLSVLKAAVR